MSVRPVDLMMVQQMNEVSQIKHNETSRPVAQQFNISAQVQKDTDNRAEQVTQKADVDNGNRKFDAKDKSDNEYHGQQKGKQKQDGKVTIKNKSEFNFDIKV